MLDLNLPIAFFGGIVSFFAPCVLPLLPAYISYVIGIVGEDGKKTDFKKLRGKIFISSVFYIIGFSTIFVLLGIGAGGIGVLLRKYDFIFQRVGGLIILILGLQFAQIVNIPLLAYEKKLKLPSWSSSLGYLRAFLLGIIFAAAWTPCVGALLGSILALAAVTSTLYEGAILLLAYSIGISLPFLIVALTLSSAEGYLSFITKHVGAISRISGVFLAIIGILLLFDRYKYLNFLVFEFAYKLGYQVK